MNVLVSPRFEFPHVLDLSATLEFFVVRIYTQHGMLFTQVISMPPAEISLKLKCHNITNEPLDINIKTINKTDADH